MPKKKKVNKTKEEIKDNAKGIKEKEKENENENEKVKTKTENENTENAEEVEMPEKSKQKKYAMRSEKVAKDDTSPDTTIVITDENIVVMNQSLQPPAVDESWEEWYSTNIMSNPDLSVLAESQVLTSVQSQGYFIDVNLNEKKVVIKPGDKGLKINFPVIRSDSLPKEGARVLKTLSTYFTFNSTYIVYSEPIFYCKEAIQYSTFSNWNEWITFMTEVVLRIEEKFYKYRVSSELENVGSKTKPMPDDQVAFDYSLFTEVRSGSQDINIMYNLLMLNASENVNGQYSRREQFICDSKYIFQFDMYRQASSMYEDYNNYYPFYDSCVGVEEIIKRHTRPDYDERKVRQPRIFMPMNVGRFIELNPLIYAEKLIEYFRPMVMRELQIYQVSPNVQTSFMMRNLRASLQNVAWNKSFVQRISTDGAVETITDLIVAALLSDIVDIEIGNFASVEANDFAGVILMYVFISIHLQAPQEFYQQSLAVFTNFFNQISYYNVEPPFTNIAALNGVGRYVFTTSTPIAGSVGVSRAMINPLADNSVQNVTQARIVLQAYVNDYSNPNNKRLFSQGILEIFGALEKRSSNLALNEMFDKIHAIYYNLGNNPYAFNKGNLDIRQRNKYKMVIKPSGFLNAMFTLSVFNEVVVSFNYIDEYMSLSQDEYELQRLLVVTEYIVNRAYASGLMVSRSEKEIIIMVMDIVNKVGNNVSFNFLNRFGISFDSLLRPKDEYAATISTSYVQQLLYGGYRDQYVLDWYDSVFRLFNIPEIVPMRNYVYYGLINTKKDVTLGFRYLENPNQIYGSRMYYISYDEYYNNRGTDVFKQLFSQAETINGFCLKIEHPILVKVEFGNLKTQNILPTFEDIEPGMQHKNALKHNDFVFYYEDITLRDEKAIKEEFRWYVEPYDRNLLSGLVTLTNDIIDYVSYKSPFKIYPPTVIMNARTDNKSI